MFELRPWAERQNLAFFVGVRKGKLKVVGIYEFYEMWFGIDHG